MSEAMSPRRHRHGSTLVLVLLLMLLLLVLGMAFMTQQSRLYGAANQAQLAAMARGLAEAGLEDARGKLEKDLLFPPPADPDQQVFTYSEPVTDIGGVTVVGTYSVTIDLRHRQQNELIAITSVGSAGQERPIQRVIYAELDISGDLVSNPKFFRFVHLEDRGGL